jgi:hypothetical protein
LFVFCLFIVCWFLGDAYQGDGVMSPLERRVPPVIEFVVRDLELLAQPFDVAVDGAVVHIDVVITGRIHQAIALLLRDTPKNDVATLKEADTKVLERGLFAWTLEPHRLLTTPVRLAIACKIRNSVTVKATDRFFQVRA